MVTAFSYFLSIIIVQSTSALQIRSPGSGQKVPSPLTTQQIESFTPFSHFAAAAYCQPSVINDWECGVNCEATSDFVTYTSGGNGQFEPYWYVGFSPSQQSAIVAHQGTDPLRIESLLIDTNVFFKKLDPTNFPGIPTDIRVHSGFADAHAKSAKQILSALRATISKHNATRVTTIGHSLGGALAVLDAVFLPLHISGVSFRTVTYGMPRVGNEDFADYVDTHLDLTHINNKMDPVPVIPPRLLGYRHASGEIHITTDEEWFSCPGQENSDKRCSVGGINVNIENHYGPYNGVIMKAGCGSR